MIRPALFAAAAAAALSACVPMNPEPGAGTIPVALQGSWGLTAADCIPGRADAKGLMEVGPATLTFYESVGTLTSVTSRSQTSLTGTFSFVGEGQRWQRTVSLELQGSGGPLIRREYGSQALALQYASCD